jgi:dolichol-phosphate mannosyltransferase
VHRTSPSHLETAQLSVAVVMPAYNESDGLSEFLRDIDEHVASMVRSLDYVIVDDASDPPLESVTRFVAPTLRGTVHLLTNEVNRGHGPSALTAYRQGLALGADLVVHVDGDGQISGADVARLLEAASDAPVVHGVRRSRTDPWYRRILSRATGLLVSRGHDGCDSNTPFRIYRPEPLSQLVLLTPQDSLVPHIHFTLLERRLGWDPQSVAVTHRSRRGRVSTGTTWRGAAAHFKLPSAHLIAFCARAAREVVQQRHARAHVTVMDAQVLDLDAPQSA